MNRKAEVNREKIMELKNESGTKIDEINDIDTIKKILEKHEYRSKKIYMEALQSYYEDKNEELSDEIKKEIKIMVKNKGISPQTKKNYMYSLNKLSSSNNIDLDKESIECIIDNIKKTTKNNTDVMKSYYCALKWYYTQNNINPGHIKVLEKNIKMSKEKMIEKTNKNEMTKKQESTYISKDALIEVHNRFAQLIYDNEETISRRIYNEFLTMSLYVLISPRRLEDFSKLCYGGVYDSNKSYSHADKNYYVLNADGTGYFIFNSYKTSWKYGQQKINSVKRLDDILQKYINKYKIKVWESVLNVDSPTVGKYIKIAFEMYTDKHITLNTLRHMHIIYMVDSGNLRTIEQKNNLAYEMGHGKDVQETYYLIADNIQNKETKILSNDKYFKKREKVDDKLT